MGTLLNWSLETTPLTLLLDEIRRAKTLKNTILENIATKKRKLLRFNATNLVFDFKGGAVEIQDEIGITSEGSVLMELSEFVTLIKKT